MLEPAGSELNKNQRLGTSYRQVKPGVNTGHGATVLQVHNIYC